MCSFDPPNSSFVPVPVTSTLPSTRLNVAGEDVDLYEFFQTRSGVLFGMPGAFNPVCTTKHAPGIRDHANDFLKKVDFIGCVVVNDPYVVKAWAKKLRIFGDSVIFVADTDATFAARLGMLSDVSGLGLGRFPRCRRFAMIISKGAKIEWIGYEDEAMASNVLSQMEALEKSGCLTGPATNPCSPSTTSSDANSTTDPTNVNARTVILQSNVVAGVPNMNLVIDYVSSSQAEYFTRTSIAHGLQLLSSHPDCCGVVVDGCRFNFVKIVFVTAGLTHAIEQSGPSCHSDDATTCDQRGNAGDVADDSSVTNETLLKPSDLELHLVHKNQNDDIVVVVLRYTCSDAACNRYLGNVMRDAAMRKQQKPSHERSSTQECSSTVKLTPLALSWLFRYQTSDTYSFHRYISNKTQPDYKDKNVIWFVEIAERLASADQISWFRSLSRGSAVEQKVADIPHTVYKVDAAFTNFLV